MLGKESTATEAVEEVIIAVGLILTDSEGIQLREHVTDEEIKNALWSIPGNKSPGPDGFTSQFFKDAWTVCGKDFTKAVRDFFIPGKILNQLNTTNLTLIPKKLNPSSGIEFRPIACCNVTYKVIAKVICGKLKTALSSLVDQRQAAFLEGRDILHGCIMC